METLYCGKTTKRQSGEFDNIWVYGDLVTSKGKSYIHPKNNVFETQGELGKLLILHEVIPESVGLYTGRNDNKGNKIFTGNILCFDTTRNACGIVRFGEFRELHEDEEYQGSVGFYIEHLFYKNERKNLLWLIEDCEVVGNVTDNKELLR